jgi:aspartate kinase
VVVVSAIRGVTDELQRILDRTALQSGKDRRMLEEHVSGLLVDLRIRHLQGLESWLSEEVTRLLTQRVDQELGRLRRALALEQALGGRSALSRHEVLAAGERLSVARLAACLRQDGLQPCEVDGVEVLRKSRHGAVHLERMDRGLDVLHQWAASPGGIPVVAGFVAADSDGGTATLGRGASDLSATALAALLGAEVVEIWTDTAGILSADPKWVPEARTLRHLHPEEASALARYGARVLHPEALAPLVGGVMAVRVLSTLEPTAPGTEIGTTAGLALWEPTRRNEKCGLAKSITFLQLEGRDLLALAVLTDQEQPLTVLRVLEGLLEGLGRPMAESRIESAGPSHLVIAMVAMTTPSGIGELLRHLHQGLCRSHVAQRSTDTTTASLDVPSPALLGSSLGRVACLPRRQRSGSESR